MCVCVGVRVGISSPLPDIHPMSQYTVYYLYPESFINTNTVDNVKTTFNKLIVHLYLICEGTRFISINNGVNQYG